MVGLPVSTDWRGQRSLIRGPFSYRGTHGQKDTDRTAKSVASMLKVGLSLTNSGLVIV